MMRKAMDRMVEGYVRLRGGLRVLVEDARGLQTLEWVALSIVILALLGAVAAYLHNWGEHRGSGRGECDQALLRATREWRPVRPVIPKSLSCTSLAGAGVHGAPAPCFGSPPAKLQRDLPVRRADTEERDAPVRSGVADRWEDATQGFRQVWEGSKVPVKGVWGKVWNNVLAPMVGMLMLLGAGFLADRRLPGDPGNGNGSGISFPKRAFAVAILVPFLLPVDVSLFLLTLSNTVFLLTSPDPSSRILSLSTEVILIIGDLFLVFVHVQLVHWAITGRWIRSVEDMTDWSLRP